MIIRKSSAIRLIKEFKKLKKVIGKVTPINYKEIFVAYKKQVWRTVRRGKKEGKKDIK